MTFTWRIVMATSNFIYYFFSNTPENINVLHFSLWWWKLNTYGSLGSVIRVFVSSFSSSLSISWLRLWYRSVTLRWNLSKSLCLCMGILLRTLKPRPHVALQGPIKLNIYTKEQKKSINTHRWKKTIFILKFIPKQS